MYNINYTIYMVQILLNHENEMMHAVHDVIIGYEIKGLFYIR